MNFNNVVKKEQPAIDRWLDDWFSNQSTVCDPITWIADNIRRLYVESSDNLISLDEIIRYWTKDGNI